MSIRLLKFKSFSRDFYSEMADGIHDLVLLKGTEIFFLLFLRGLSEV